MRLLRVLGVTHQIFLLLLQRCCRSLGSILGVLILSFPSFGGKLIYALLLIKTVGQQDPMHALLIMPC